MGIIDWDALEVYLIVDKKLSIGSTYPMKSRHRILYAYFLDKDFTRQTFNGFIYFLKTKGYKESYINNFIKLGKHVAAYMGKNDLKDYTYYKEKKNNYIQLLTPQEITLLAKAVLPYSQEKNMRMQALIYLLGRTGCRINEALSLTRDDIFDTFVLFRDTKNGDDRKVPIFTHMRQMLLSLPQTSDTVFAISPQKVNEDLKRRARYCGIQKRVYAHLFRHSYINEMVTNLRTPLHIVQEVVGHKSLESTQRYLHPQFDEIIYCMEKHPLIVHEQTYTEVARLLDEFIKIHVGKQFKISYEIKESSSQITL